MRAIQTLGAPVDAHRARQPRGAQPRRRRARTRWRGATPSSRPAAGARRRTLDASLDRARRARPRRVPPRRLPRLPRLGRARRAAARARPGRHRARRDAGSCGCTSPTALPLLPGDRYVLRETGRDETVGGGEVLDVAPVLPASRARPDRDVDRVVAERGWVDADELELLTGERRPPTVGRWVVAPPALVADGRGAARQRWRRRARRPRPGRRSTSASGPCSTTLDGRRRRRHDGPARRRAPTRWPTTRSSPRWRPAGWRRPRRRASTGPSCASWRRRGVLVERDGMWFHADADRRPPAALAAAPARAPSPTASRSSEFREAAGITRKHAVPLLAELDARGVTRRRGDLRIAGPRLPPR